MRKGFLLATCNKEKKRTQRCNVVNDGKHAAKPRSKDAAELSMKRGFLLQSTPTAAKLHRKCSNQQQHPLNDKNIASKNEDSAKAAPQPQSRVHDTKTVTAPSTALLDLELATPETDSNVVSPHDDNVGSPSLVNLIGSSVGSTSSFSNDPEHISDHTHSLIIEQTYKRPISVVEEADSTNDNSSDRKGNKPNDTTNNDNDMDSFAFANEVSQLLSKLRRAQKSKNKSKREDKEDDSSIGISQFMNQKSEQLVKAFVGKYVQDSSVDTRVRLNQIWTIVLEHIAQDYNVLGVSRKKRKKSLITNISPHFVLGVGVLGVSSDVALESITDALTELVNFILQPTGNDEVKQKRYKTEAIGAILLLQCHFRCLRLETRFCEETTGLDRVEVESNILLKNVIPALQSIVVKEAKRTLLTAITSDTFFELIEIFPRIDAHASSQLFWTEILPRVDTMLDMHRLWMTKARPSPLFFNVAYEIILPPILEYLTEAHPTNNGSSSASYLLCNVIKGNSEEDADDFVRCLISSTQHLGGCKSIFENHGGNWKSYLLEYDEGTMYKNMLLATARSMLDKPSSSVPLSLFSCLVNVTNNREETYPERRILLATINVVHFATNEVRISGEFDADDEEAVFARISPLLILRRLPKAYYEILHGQIESNTEDSRVIMSELAAALASRFRAHALNDFEGRIAKEEKMLLAQVAGHCLPFSISCDDVSVSLFDLFEKPFSSTLDIVNSSNSKAPSCLQYVNESKLALFAICQHIPGAKNEDTSGTAFVRVASFVLDYLLHPHPTCGGNKIDDELAKLHTGCLHFLVVSIDTLFARKANPSESLHDGNINRDTFFGGLIITFEMTSSILFNAVGNERRFSASTQTSILNAIIVYSQTCTTDRLELFASGILPTLLKWLDHGTICDGVHQPLCVAASLQVAYTMFARLGSFDWVTKFCEDSESDFLRLTFSCASKALYSEVSPLRQAALKVILTAIACNQDLEKSLEPIDIQYTLLAVRIVAHEDQSEEVRRLAMEILPHLDI